MHISCATQTFMRLWSRRHQQTDLLLLWVSDKFRRENRTHFSMVVLRKKP